MSTLVKFLKSDNGEVFAYFPQLNHNKRLYGNTMKTCYTRIGGHSSVHRDYVSECTEPKMVECLNLMGELSNIGYDFKVINKFPEVEVLTDEILTTIINKN